MPRARSAKAEEALALYRQGVKLKDIAVKLGVPEGTVRRWKSSFEWEDRKQDPEDRRVNERKRKNVRNHTERSLKTFAKNTERSERSERETNAEKARREAAAKDVEAVLRNDELSDRQKLFCLHYVRSFNATKAYQKAYGCSYEAACGHSADMLKKVEIVKEIKRLKRDRFNRALMEAPDIFQKYIDIAFLDITDFLSFGTEEAPLLDNNGNAVMMSDKETGEPVPITRKRNFVTFRDSAEVDGTLIQEVRNGKDGVCVKLMDRQKALDWLAEHMEILTAEQKARIDRLKADTPETGAEGSGSLAEVIIRAYEKNGEVTE